MVMPPALTLAPLGLDEASVPATARELRLKSAATIVVRPLRMECFMAPSFFLAAQRSVACRCPHEPGVESCSCVRAPRDDGALEKTNGEIHEVAHDADDDDADDDDARLSCCPASSMSQPSP